MNNDDKKTLRQLSKWPLDRYRSTQPICDTLHGIALLKAFVDSLWDRRETEDYSVYMFAELMALAQHVSESLSYSEKEELENEEKEETASDILKQLFHETEISKLPPFQIGGEYRVSITMENSLYKKLTDEATKEY